MTDLRELRFTLLTDGSSDAVLQYHLEWLLRQHTQVALQPAWADLSRVPRAPRTLAERIALAVDLYPSEVLFVHRDAERTPRDRRVTEIQAARGNLATPVVCVIPVRMQEAWLLFHEAAIRQAAGNPHGRAPLTLPRMAHIEQIADPKSLLHDMLRTASGLSGRRLKDFSPHRAARRIGLYITDFSPLLALAAFNALDTDIQAVLAAHGW